MTEQTLSYEEYLDSLPEGRRAEIERVWAVVRENIGDGYTEEIDAKFLSFKAGGDWLVALANQKNYMSLYLMPLYMFPEMRAKFDAATAGMGLKCGKSCINFKRAEQLPLEVVSEIVGRFDADTYEEQVREIRSASRQEKSKS